MALDVGNIYAELHGDIDKLAFNTENKFDELTAQIGQLDIDINTVSSRISAIGVSVNDLSSRVGILENPEYVEVVADGVKTCTELLESLDGLINRSKITPKSVLEYIRSSTSTLYYNISQLSSSWFAYTNIERRSNRIEQRNICMYGSSSLIDKYTIATSGTTYEDLSSSVPDNGAIIRVYY